MFLHIETAPEGGDFLRQVTRAERDWLPQEAFARQREDEGLRFAGQEEDQRLVGTEELLYLVGRKRPWARQRRIVGKSLLEAPVMAAIPAFDIARSSLRSSSIAVRSC